MKQILNWAGKVVGFHYKAVLVGTTTLQEKSDSMKLLCNTKM